MKIYTDQEIVEECKDLIEGLKKCVRDVLPLYPKFSLTGMATAIPCDGRLARLVPLHFPINKNHTAPFIPLASFRIQLESIDETLLVTIAK